MALLEELCHGVGGNDKGDDTTTQDLQFALSASHFCLAQDVIYLFSGQGFSV